MNIFHQILILATLLLSLLIDAVFIYKKRPGIGYLLGLSPILAFWLYIVLKAPSKAYCQQNPGACEWVGIGLLMYTGLSIILLVTYTLLSVGMVILSRRVIPSPKIIRKFTPLLGVVLLVLSSILGACGGNFIYKSGILVRWQNLGNPPEPNVTRRLPGEKSVKIEYYDIEYIQVITNQNRRFRTDYEFCLSNQRPSENCWGFGQEDFIQGEYQSCGLKFQIPIPPGKAIDRVSAKLCSDFDTFQTDYVLLNDGNVWVWHYHARTDPLAIFTFTIIPGAMIGMFLGIIILFFITKPKDAFHSSIPV